MLQTAFWVALLVFDDCCDLAVWLLVDGANPGRAALPDWWPR
jgi:hypothetical protein